MNDAARRSDAVSQDLAFPYPDPPAPGELREIAPGILWTRIPLPFKLDHVNVYFLEDDGGWAVVDTGTADEPARQAWDVLLGGKLAGATFTKLIATHGHADHIGLAGWLCKRLGVPLLTSRTSYLGSTAMLLAPEALEAQEHRDFHLRHGMNEEAASFVAMRGHAYRRMVAPLPASFHRLAAGDTPSIGGRTFEVLTGDGHAPEQLMLHCVSENVLLAADQVIAGISPIIGLGATEPDDDPLGLYLNSLAMLETGIPRSTLVLSGHQLPFLGLQDRCRQLAALHAKRCDMIAEACRHAPRSVGELVPVLFRRSLDVRQYSFAFSETHAHVNHLVARGEALWQYEDGLSRAHIM